MSQDCTKKKRKSVRLCATRLIRLMQYDWFLRHFRLFTQPPARSSFISTMVIAHSCWNVMKLCWKILAPHSHIVLTCRCQSCWVVPERCAAVFAVSRLWPNYAHIHYQWIHFASGFSVVVSLFHLNCVIAALLHIQLWYRHCAEHTIITFSPFSAHQPHTHKQTDTHTSLNCHLKPLRAGFSYPRQSFC